MKEYFVGMDVHENSYSLCTYCWGDNIVQNKTKMQADPKLIVKYIENFRKRTGEECTFTCAYEAGCLGFTLYRKLTNAGIKCVIMAPSTMKKSAKSRKNKNDMRDAADIATCLAHCDYNEVAVPTEENQAMRDYIRMRQDYVEILKMVKQKIRSFLVARGYQYEGGKNSWTQKHIEWLRSIKLEGMDALTLEEHLLELDHLMEKIKRLETKIEEMTQKEAYREGAARIGCMLGMGTINTMTILTEIGDFKRFARAEQFASYLGLTPGEDSSGEKTKHLSITKAGNPYARRVLVEAAQSYATGRPGSKGAILKRRQSGVNPNIVYQADKGNLRLRKRYKYLTLGVNKKSNVAKVAIARELACFIWSLMTMDLPRPG